MAFPKKLHHAISFFDICLIPYKTDSANSGLALLSLLIIAPQNQFYLLIYQVEEIQ